MLGELAAIYPEREGLFDAAPYDHNNLIVPFEEVCTKIRNLLVGAKRNVLKQDFQRAGRRMVAPMAEDHFRLPNEYYLGIRTRMDPRALVRLVEDYTKFKLMPQQDVESDIYGLRLEHAPYPPLALPAAVGLHYFLINRAESGRKWDQVRQQRGMAARWPEDERSDFAMALFMPVPETDGGLAPPSQQAAPAAAAGATVGASAGGGPSLSRLRGTPSQ